MLKLGGKESIMDELEAYRVAQESTGKTELISAIYVYILSSPAGNKTAESDTFGRGGEHEHEHET
jgi:hypothetical protein